MIVEMLLGVMLFAPMFTMTWLIVIDVAEAL